MPESEKPETIHQRLKRLSLNSQPGDKFVKGTGLGPVTVMPLPRANAAPPFFCPQCGNEVEYTYDARTGVYTPDECRKPNCLNLHSSVVN